MFPVAVRFRRGPRVLRMKFASIKSLQRLEYLPRRLDEWKEWIVSIRTFHVKLLARDAGHYHAASSILRVLILGAGGFVGRALSARLAQTPAVIEALTLVDQQDFSVPASAAIPISKRIGNFAEPRFCQSLLDGAQAVVVLAAVLGGTAENYYSLARRINVDATLSLFEALRNACEPPRIVFASSIAVFGAPLPQWVDDATPARPTLIYGAQKLMMEVALDHFTRRGWLDGIALRFPGIVARAGADSKLKSAFLNSLFYAVRDGDEIELPVSANCTTWLMSAAKVAENVEHALHVPRAALGENCTLNLPCIRVTMEDLVQGLKRLYPDSGARIRYQPDPAIEAQFGRYPPLVAALGHRLGFSADDSIDALIRGAMP
jgi:D-erythronate 2-dehydrogenase